MARVYESAELEGLTDSNPLTVQHNYGKIPTVYTVYRVVSGTEMGWENDVDQRLPGVYVDSFDPSEAVIKCRTGYTFSGNCKLVMFDNN